MLTKVNTCALTGLDGQIIEVEVDVAPGLPHFVVVGLPDAAVQESRERVRSAIRNSGFEFPMRRITVSLAPADIRKEGPSYDLPIAVGMLASSGQIDIMLGETVLIGELSLEGNLRHTDGILPMVGVARDRGMRTAVVPQTNADEAALVEGVDVLGARTLRELVEHIRGDAPILTHTPTLELSRIAPEDYSIDMADIRGQDQAKRAIEIAAAGGHNLLMTGPPGSGKTLLARAMASILPPLTPPEALETTKVYSIAGMLRDDTPLVSTRPFRSPHHTISHAGLVGGGRFPKPGEVSLSHRGVLFLDELPEFGHSVLEVLRQPIEDKVVTISRANGSVTYPASFMLVGAMNPCFCGNYGDPRKTCTCSSQLLSRYQKRISGPLLDRMDIFIDVPRVEYEKLTGDVTGEPSARIRERVCHARQVQQARFRESCVQCNADMGPSDVWKFCRMDDEAEGLARAVMERMHFSARAFHRTLKLARTIADLSGDDIIGMPHLAEAVQYRQRGAE